MNEACDLNKREGGVSEDYEDKENNDWPFTWICYDCNVEAY